MPHHMASKCRMEHTLRILEELTRFLGVTDDSRERKNRQKLLRNLRVTRNSDYSAIVLILPFFCTGLGDYRLYSGVASRRRQSPK